MYTFQEIVAKLSHFWQQQGCIICQPYDVEKGAATFSPHTFFRCLGPEPFHAAYIEPCRRPKDGRYALNPNRLQHYFQYQVILKPSPYNIQDLYLQSLEAIGLKLDEHDIRFVHDDWEQPTIGAWGLGWEVWIDGQECTQFTYFQAVAGVALKPITGEITYGIERLALYLQNKNSVFDLQWNDHISYADLWKQNEIEWSRYNFEKSDPKMWFSLFETYEKEAKRLVEAKLPIPALDFVMKASHSFNMLDARGAISVTERASYIATIRDISRAVAECYLESRKELGYPLQNKIPHTLSSLAPIPSVTIEHKEMKQAEDLIIEIGCEELPATFVPIGMDNFKRAIENLLTKEELSFSSVTSYGTARRLAIAIQGLAPYKSAKCQEKKGPALSAAFDEKGSPTPATIGFLKGVGLPPYKKADFEGSAIDAIWIDKVKETPYIFGMQKTERELTQLILERELPKLILGIDFPKKMRWADLDITFARPLRWIAALYGKEVLSFSVGPINSSCYSFGHRQLSKEMFRLDDATNYKEELRKREVIVDQAERKQEILQQLQVLEKSSGYTILEKERVIPQVLYLVEKPYPALAGFDATFLQAPREVLISEMCEHQKYFPVSDSKGDLVNHFVITANIPSTQSIERGNQKVLSARLSDGAFLYAQDLKTTLEGFSEKLKGIVFQKGLGTLYDKVERMQKEILIIGRYLPHSSPAYLKEAALLAKADLATEVVQEFPELQGAMGRVYALKQGKAEEVALALDEQWMPRGEQSPLPKTVTGIALSLTEKIDNLISFFGLGLKPTSSSDPFALRRQALGILKIILAHNITIDLKKALYDCTAYFPDSISKKREAVILDVFDFIQQRAKSYFQDEGFSKDVIEACLSIREGDLLDVYKRIQALHTFKNESSNFAKLGEVHKRSLGQTSGFTKFTVNKTYLTDSQELDLYKVIGDITPKYSSLVVEQNYSKALMLIATLQPLLSELFEKVKILSDDNKIRENRIALLQEVSALFEQIADFQKIQDR